MPVVIVDGIQCMMQYGEHGEVKVLHKGIEKSSVMLSDLQHFPQSYNHKDNITRS